MMEYSNVLGLDLSRLALGTVQFGMDYGISNRTGQPSKKEIQDILSLAFEAGVNLLDTAYAYGDSEEIIGEMLNLYQQGDKVVVVTKLKSLDNDLPLSTLQAEIKESIYTSLRRLRLESIPIFLLHKPEHLTAYGGAIVEQLLRLREQGIIRHIGVSIYTPQEADIVASMDAIEAVQIPLNVLDQRLIRSGFLSLAKSRNIAVFVRSVFLQGLILMDSSDVPEQLKAVLPFKKELYEMYIRSGRTVAEIALKFCLGQQGVTSVLVGIDNAAQMKQNISLFATDPLDSELESEILERFTSVPEYIINPSVWKSLGVEIYR